MDLLFISTFRELPKRGNVPSRIDIQLQFVAIIVNVADIRIVGKSKHDPDFQ